MKRWRSRRRRRSTTTTTSSADNDVTSSTSSTSTDVVDVWSSTNSKQGNTFSLIITITVPSITIAGASSICRMIASTISQAPSRWRSLSVLLLSLSSSPLLNFVEILAVLVVIFFVVLRWPLSLSCRVLIFEVPLAPLTMALTALKLEDLAPGSVGSCLSVPLQSNVFDISGSSLLHW